jgi:ribonuclease BN (tRNA processing enzyme)
MQPDPPVFAMDVLGAGPAYTDRPGASGAAYLIRSPGAAVLLDLGQGSFPRLTATLEPSTLTGIVVSHLHPDHFIDLVPLRHYLAYQFEPGRHVRVIAPHGLAGRLDALHAQPGFTATALDVEPFGTDTMTLGDLGLEARHVRHTDDSHAIRLTPPGGGPGLVYSGDCGAAQDLAPLIRPRDTLLIEAAFGLGPVPPGAMHLDAPAIIELIAATRPGRVIVTHVQMGHEAEDVAAALRERHAGPVVVAEPGLRFDLAA